MSGFVLTDGVYEITDLALVGMQLLLPQIAKTSNFNSEKDVTEANCLGPNVDQAGTTTMASHRLNYLLSSLKSTPTS